MSDGIKKINEHLLKEGRALVLTTFINDTTHLTEGTLYVNPLAGELKYISLNSDNQKSWSNFKIEKLFAAGSFDSSLILDNSLHATKLVDLSISSTKIADSAITSNKIENGAVIDSKLVLNNIDGDKLKDSSITTNKIHAGAITTSLIANRTITTEKIADKSILNYLIADGAINTNNIINESITTSKIANKSITGALIADSSISSNHIGFKEVKNNNLENASITSEKIADGSITAKKIPNYTITNNHIDSIDGYKILDGTISSSKIRNSSITNNLIADASITKNKLDSNIQTAINNSITIQPNVIIDNKEYYGTALISGNVFIKNPDNSKAMLQVNGDINATGDITGARVFNPYFADIAEAYIPTCDLKPGDPVCLSKEGNLKVEKLNNNNIDRFLGFVSDQYATLFGADKKDIESGKMIAVTLIGRIKCNLGNNVEGKVGEYISIILQDNNVSFMTTPNKTINSVGKLLENKSYNKSMVLCQLWT